NLEDLRELPGQLGGVEGLLPLGLQRRDPGLQLGVRGDGLVDQRAVAGALRGQPLVRRSLLILLERRDLLDEYLDLPGDLPAEPLGVPRDVAWPGLLPHRVFLPVYCAIA